jgi:hypothetical protein
MKTRYQTKVITIANATADATTTTDDIQPDKSYDKVTGIAVEQVSAGGATYLRMGIRDRNKNIQDVSHINNFLASTAVDPDRKFKTVDVDIEDGNSWYFDLVNDGALTSEAKVEVILRLEKQNQI